jgi:hypothetical protein
MARILHVGNFGLTAKGAFQHSVAIKLSNGLIRDGHHVVNFSDREVARAGTILGHRKFGRAAANKALTRLCREVAPELILLGHADMIDAATVADLRAMAWKPRIVQWNVDPIFDADNVKRILGKIDHVDATLVSSAGDSLAPLKAPGRIVGFLPNPVDISIERGANHLRADLPYDLFYAVGHPSRPLRNICGRDWDMEKFLRMLMKALPKARVMLAGLLGHPHLAGAKYQAALESAAIGLNLSRRGDVPLYSSDRLAHMIGNGQAIAIERATGYDALFSDGEMIFFSSLDELIAKLQRHIADPAARQDVAQRGRARYIELFNERVVAGYVVEVAFGRLDPARYPWPTLA